jgi:Fic family protein
MNSLLATHELLKASDFPAVLMASIIAFGFVFIHPFEDGNGRIHRYLLHHVLAEKLFTPKGIVFPVSAVILERIVEYKSVLEAYSKPRLEFVKWRPTTKGNIELLNDTIDLYSYFDATHQAEFLYECVQETIQNTLPAEVAYLQKYDLLSNFIKNYLDMPDKTVDLLIRFLINNKGILSARALSQEFKGLEKKEIAAIEEKYHEIFI